MLANKIKSNKILAQGQIISTKKKQITNNYFMYMQCNKH